MTILTMRLKLVDSEPLIQLVKQRPCLYDPKCEEYLSRRLKCDAWTEIAQVFVGEAWHALSPSEQETMRNDVKVRWKSLKDAYIRSLKLRDTNTSRSTQHRPYLYDKQMRFLSSTHLAKEHQGEEEVVDEDCGVNEEEIEYDEKEIYSILEVGVELEDESTTPFNENFDQDSSTSSRTAQEPLKIRENDSQPRLKRKKTQEESMFSFLPEGATAVELDPMSIPNANYIDEDKFFLLSLLPRLKHMTDVEKLDFKISVMQLLKAGVINRNRRDKRKSST